MSAPVMPENLDGNKPIDIDIVLPLNQSVLQNEFSSDVELRFGYSIGYFNFVLEKTLVSEIVIEPTIFPVPNGPRWLPGMINLRGNILPVIDLTHMIGTRLKSSSGHFVLVVDEGAQALALFIDALPKSLSEPINADEIGNMNSIPADFLAPGVQAEGKIWLELDIKSLAMKMKDEEEGRQRSIAI